MNEERKRNSAAMKHVEHLPSNDTAQGVAFCPICRMRLYFGTNGDGDLVALDWATGKPHIHQEAVRHNIGTEKQSIEQSTLEVHTWPGRAESG